MCRSSGGQSQLEDLVPFSLQRGDGAQLRQGDGNAVAQGPVRAEEVVGSHEEGGEGPGAVARGEAAGGAHMVFVSAIEALDELFEGTILLGDGVEIFQADHLQEREGRLLG